MQAVLVVEDDVRLRGTVATALADRYMVRATASVHEAKDFLADNPVDAVILDLTVSEGSGFALLSYARQLSRRPRLIVFSRTDSVPKAVKAMRLGADSYLRRSRDPRAFRRGIQDVLDVPVNKQN